ncbi:enolase, partial [Escherichia coli]|nr:enolase [Escherichia coli]
MKIESVHVTVFQYPKRRVSDSAGHSHPGAESMAKMAMLTITADDGAQGFSFAPPEVVRPFVVNTFFRKVLVGQDPFNRERIWQDLNHWQRGSAHQLTERALSFIEQALWDLIGRSLKMPVYKLLGGYRDTVPAYGSTMCG